MAATRLIALHANKGRTVAQSLGDRTDYAKNPEKTEKGELVTAYGCDPMTVDEEFLLQKRRYFQQTGKSQKSDVIAYQIRQSFKPGEITPEEANRLGHELAMRFTKGKFSSVMKPGWNVVFPIVQSFKKVDVRTKAVDVPEQDAITKDNVSVRINAVIYYKIFDAIKAILAVENFYYAVSQLAQTTMRNAVGEVELDELLSERETISSKICQIIDKATDPWGIKVENVELKDVALPE